MAGLHVAQMALTGQPRILHFAPERGLAAILKRLGGPNYRAVDIDPARYPGLDVEPFDLCADVFDLPPASYDLVVHNHVLEHIECNYSAVLLRLMKAVAPAGTMLFSMPILNGPFTEELMTGTLDEKRRRFGEMIHVRRFGRDFLPQTLGMLFTVPDQYDLTKRFPPSVLAEANIPEHHWRAYTGASIFRVGHADLRM